MQKSPVSVFVIDDDRQFGRSLQWMLAGLHYNVELFDSAEAFLNEAAGKRGCVVVDVRMPGIDGIELQNRLHQVSSALPVIVMSGNADVSVAVAAMESGAISFLEKPFSRDRLLQLIERATVQAGDNEKLETRRQADEAMVAALTPREREVLGLVSHGDPTKVIARKLGVSARTVDKHRERILSKTRAESWAQLVALSERLHLAPDYREATGTD